MATAVSRKARPPLQTICTGPHCIRAGQRKEEARKHPFQQEVLAQMTFHEDGSVAEW